MYRDHFLSLVYIERLIDSLQNELVSLEIAYYLCLQGRSEEALTHLRSVALEGSCSTNPLFQLYLGAVLTSSIIIPLMTIIF